MGSSGSGADWTLRSRYRRIGLGYGNAKFDQAAGMMLLPSHKGNEGDYHAVRESVQYARILLDRQEEPDLKTVERILAAVKKAGGWAAAGEPDADLEAVQAMLEMLYRHWSRLGEEAKSFIQTDVAACLRSGLDRRASPATSGSALLAGALLVCGGEWFADPELVRKGRGIFEEAALCAGATGALEEYNSPTRSAIMLHALAIVLRHARDSETVKRVETLWASIWLSLLEHAHFSTGQLAGPHSRDEGRDMRRDTRGPVKYYLHRAFGSAFPLGCEAAGEPGDLFPALIADDPDCPDQLRRLAQELKIPRSITEIPDSYSGYRERTGAEVRGQAGGHSGLPAGSADRKGRPGRPGFHGSVKRITTYLTGNYCVGSVNCESLTGESAPILAHWTSSRRDRANYAAALALCGGTGTLDFLPGSVMCSAQQEGRVLGLLRFETDPQGKCFRAGRAALAFQINRDCSPEVVMVGEREPGQFRLDRGIIVRAEGLLVGIRVLRARLGGASIKAEINENPAPGAHAEGEMGMHLVFEPFSPVAGEPAYAAFALEVAEEEAAEGVSGMTRRLRAARVADEGLAAGTIRLAWGSTLSLSTSIRVLSPDSWMDREGSVA